MKAYIVRHGNTFAPGEPPRRIGARTDLPLVESGRAQARALGAMFRARGVAFDRCLVSPLLRTRETAAIIAPDAALETVDWLREIDHGPDEGRTESDVLARVGAAASAAWDDRAEPPPGWVVDRDERITAWRVFFASPGSESVLLVTSNGAARYARIALGLSPARMRTGSYGTLIRDNQRIRLADWDVRPA